MSRALEGERGREESRIRNRSIPPPVADALLRFLYFIPVGVQPDQKHSAVCMGTPIHLWYFGRGRGGGKGRESGEGKRIRRWEDVNVVERRTTDKDRPVRSFVAASRDGGVVVGWRCVG